MSNSRSVRYPNVAINPGDTGNDGKTLIYNFIYDTGSGTWLYNEKVNSEAPVVNEMWRDGRTVTG